MSWKLWNIFLWFLKVSLIVRKSKIIFLKFDKSWNVLQASEYFSMILRQLSGSLTSFELYCKLQNIFQPFFKVSLIAKRSKIIFLKFDKSWNVLQASEYFSTIFKSLMDCQKVQDNFPEVWQVMNCIASFKTFFYHFLKSPWLPEGPR